MMKLVRLFNILRVALRYGLDEIAISRLAIPRAAEWLNRILFWRDLSAPRGVRLRCALEDLGPIFIKFGQVLSTRRDLMAPDIADELAKLQNRVPEFDSDLAIAQITKSLGRHPDQLFATFERKPEASASIAQVHFATLQDGTEVAVKVLRPGIRKLIEKDVALMYSAAGWAEKVWADSRRLRPREVVAEFDKYLDDELDLMREASNASQLRRNFADSTQLIVPEIFWNYCSVEVMTMERMHGIPISHIDRLVEAGLDMKRLSKDGVEIFMTQVFRDGFFHADMHPGNIFVSVAPATFGRYIALDFGIMGTLSDFDKDYLSQNFLAFFRRDYRRVAEAHIECGWAPRETRVEDLEGAVRACCEPIFDKPLKDFSFGQVLMRLFQTSRRFNIQIQPQLVLLQKTMLNVEGLGRQLDPDLDLWKTAKPFLEEWMKEQIGWRSVLERIKQEAPRYGHIFPQLPRLAHQALTAAAHPQNKEVELLKGMIAEQKRTNRLLTLVLCFGFGVLLGILLIRLFPSLRHLPF